MIREIDSNKKEETQNLTEKDENRVKFTKSGYIISISDKVIKLPKHYLETKVVIFQQQKKETKVDHKLGLEQQNSIKKEKLPQP